jgi:hypothetical protein
MFLKPSQRSCPSVCTSHRDALVLAGIRTSPVWVKVSHSPQRSSKPTIACRVALQPRALTLAVGGVGARLGTVGTTLHMEPGIMAAAYRAEGNAIRFGYCCDCPNSCSYSSNQIDICRSKYPVKICIVWKTDRSKVPTPNAFFSAAADRATEMMRCEVEVEDLSATRSEAQIFSPSLRNTTLLDLSPSSHDVMSSDG